MSEKKTSVLWTFTDEPKTFMLPHIGNSSRGERRQQGGGVVASFANSAERLLSEQSVLLLGEANSQTRKELL